MALIACPACTRQVSEEAFACPACGHPISMKADGHGSGIARVFGGVAGTYITANALVGLVVGVVFFICAAAVIITLILANA